MYEILMVIYLVVALALVGFILVQQGKGAGMGASFGSGASGTVFGAGGSGNFLTKTTTVLAIIFFGVALGLGNITIEKSTSPETNSLFPVDGTEVAPETSSELPSDLPTATETDLPVSEMPVSELPSSDLPEATKETTAEETDVKSEEPESKDDSTK